MNIYWLANEEMKRLWDQWGIENEQAKAALTKNVKQYYLDNCDALQEEIVRFRNLIFKNLKDNDPLLQEKVAELALTGDTHE